jgi:hypothetical protein
MLSEFPARKEFVSVNFYPTRVFNRKTNLRFSFFFNFWSLPERMIVMQERLLFWHLKHPA